MSATGGTAPYTYTVSVDGVNIFTGTNPSFSWNTTTVANGGIRVEPRLVRGVISPDGEFLGTQPTPARRVVSTATARIVTGMLARAVEAGTGQEAQIPGYRVAGKTGTAQKPLPTGGYGNSYVSSFGGFAPARRPEVMALVVLHEPRPIWGGSTAAPTFRTIM